MDKSREESIKEFRGAFKNLSEKDRKLEAARINRIVNHIPICVLEDWEENKTLKFPDIANLREYLWQKKKLRTTHNMIYKALRGQYSSAYGFKMYYMYEEV
jgi:hypothetical protein